MTITLTAKAIERFWKDTHHEPNSGCWLWGGACDQHGYGCINNNYVSIRAHRASWLIHYGDIGTMMVLHRCDNPPCVNPAHLFLGTQEDNARDMFAKGRAVITNLPPNPSGEMCSAAILTECDAHSILRRADGGIRKVKIAEEFKVSVSTVYNICSGKTWKHLPRNNATRAHVAADAGRT